ncbi:hypothetical protein Nstercoris_02274 (plasmid) [Nitrosomonas stercoris]|uniref:Conjugal transfer protein TrbM n=1 Tax=Nitrosomonas stercoris TaxID=1444684 RepID=A0A4Y1YT98_9PROT|nr:hypothetical protein Nstercoris_02274 [Nitrosomonas stercoris]
MNKIVMRKVIGVAMLTALASSGATADQVFTGDTRLACEAILCLSSSQRPNECNPSLSRYFSITHIKWSNTVKARRSFLNTCPTAKDVSANMPQLVEGIVNGAGRCDADYLNRTQQIQMKRKVCKGWNNNFMSNMSSACVTETYYGIKNSLPDYCVAYLDNSYTDAGIAPKYVGTMEQNGRWVPGKDFVTEQARWEQAHPEEREVYPWLKPSSY